MDNGIREKESPPVAIQQGTNGANLNMDPVTGWAIANIGSNLLGGLFGKSGQKSANAANLQIARENREWQERMSNTAYQRAAQDLQAAGLNRILALGKPASTPSGNIATMQNENAPIQTALQNTMAQTKLLTEQARKTGYEADALRPKAAVYDKGGEIIEGGIKKIESFDWGAMWDRFKTDAVTAFGWMKGKLDELDARSMIDQAKRDATSAKEVTTNAVQAAKDAIRQSLAGTDVRPELAERQLINAVSQMDLPPMTDQEKLVWGTQNIERVQEYLRRRKNLN